MNVLDLFSGIGGFSLGLERAGSATRYFCELDPYCRRVLAKHWPSVPCFEDVRTLRGTDVTDIDLICGGFPCQDISVAGKNAGLNGSRSGLWFEFRRLIEEIRPRYALIENVAVLRSRGLDQVLREIAALGYDAEWHCIPASAVGAPHRRDRVWIVAYRNMQRVEKRRALTEDANSGGQGHGDGQSTSGENGDVANSDSERCTNIQGSQAISCRARFRAVSHSSWWNIEPNVGRVAHGVPHRVDRLRGLGNAIVPQIAEILGRAILEYEHSLTVRLRG